MIDQQTKATAPAPEIASGARPAPANWEIAKGLEMVAGQMAQVMASLATIHKALSGAPVDGEQQPEQPETVTNG